MGMVPKHILCTNDANLAVRNSVEFSATCQLTPPAGGMNPAKSGTHFEDNRAAPSFTCVNHVQ